MIIRWFALLSALTLISCASDPWVITVIGKREHYCRVSSDWLTGELTMYDCHVRQR